MKDIKEFMNESSINESREIDYRVLMVDVKDEEGLPITITLSVDAKYQKQFEDWLNDSEGNLFMHADGGNVEY
jgi:hypothetical protein